MLKSFSAISVTTAFALNFAVASVTADELLLTPDQIDAVLAHGPWPAEPKIDISNKVSGNKQAIELGEQLFFSELLSDENSMSCATCHKQELGFSDGLARSQGKKVLDRNSLSLFNVSYNRWFGWDGANDNLWAQSIAPILHPDEMALAASDATKIASNPTFESTYKDLFGEATSLSDEQNLVNIAKVLAAFQETIVTGKTEFDRFRDALEKEDFKTAATYPKAAQRGLAVFVGKGRCNFCHVGSLFSNGEFHDAGVPYFIEAGRVDEGRHAGLQKLAASKFTLQGDYSDDPNKKEGWKSRQVLPKHADFGTFRTPSLRNVAKTAPYMHNGSLETLEDVIKHYSNINIERLHADGEAILVPLNLDDGEIADLVSFLKTLSD